LKRIATTYFLLPLRIGFVNTATPGIWGVELTPFATGAYATAVTIIAGILAFRSHFGAALGVLFAGILLYTGFIGLPWLPLVAGATLMGWRFGGPQLAAITLGGLGVIAAGGIWQSAMFSAYLMAAAIATSIVAGGALGIAAAEFDGVSRAIRPVNDFLQTIPPFVILIPLIMFFQVGDFSSYLAIVAYAVVPMIRYTELGLRNVPATQIEAGEFAGCTRLQLVGLVKLPAARKGLLLGLNQTVMAALAMLAVAALVGSRGLGQDVYVALSKADPGFGLLAGLSIAILAMLSDRFIRHAAA
jgi:glycine betaine/proline transport system permease protein